MLGTVLAVGLVLAGCKTDADDDTLPSPGGGGKPALLATDGNVTYEQAIAKLDEILAYSGTPEHIKGSVEALKVTITTTASNWSVVQSAHVTSINAVIYGIP
jgi:hypothetical protein